MPPSPTQPVAVIGASGALGFGLAIRLAQAGVPIAIGSRDASRAEHTVESATALVPEGHFTANDNERAARSAGSVILSVPFRNQAETVKSLAPALHPGQLLIDASVPLAAAVGGRATRMLGVWQGSAAQQARELVPEGVRVVSALHTVSAASLADLEHPLDQDVLLCGDSHEDKRDVAKLLELIDGLRCVDCGRLEMARITESLTALLISVNARYKVHAGIRITGLRDPTWE
ncbi:MAG TPA: NADPH-dependent F420 reductase [Solirubrobacteraceae bacterium]|nr:NADPH-dependent F420 reductase [Solirubrobacteraceae bacterium]